jgi:hypothetical protein
VQVELEDPVENIGAKLVRQAAARTNDLAGDGTTTSVVLAAGIIAEGMKVQSTTSMCPSYSTGQLLGFPNCLHMFGGSVGG